MSSSTISEAYFNKAHAVALPLCDFYDKLTKHKLVMKAVSENLANMDMTPKVKLSVFIISDLICCYEHLGHNAEDLHGREGLPLLMVESYLLGSLKFTYFVFNSKTFEGVIDNVDKAIAEVDGVISISESEWLNEIEPKAEGKQNNGQESKGI